MKIRMKKIIIIGLILLGSLEMAAQDRDDHRERIRALKTAHITEGLQLTPQEAEKFWPVYNKFDEKRRSLRRREHADIEDIECITEEEANKMLEEYVQIEREDYLLQKEFFRELKTMLSAQRILELRKVEDDFHRRLLKEYRERHSKDK